MRETRPLVYASSLPATNSPNLPECDGWLALLALCQLSKAVRSSDTIPLAVTASWMALVILESSHWSRAAARAVGVTVVTESFPKIAVARREEKRGLLAREDENVVDDQLRVVATEVKEVLSDLSVCGDDERVCGVEWENGEILIEGEMMNKGGGDAKI